jgi:hypothetical protein
MGRRPLPARDQARFGAGIMALTWSEKLERVTRIELALSAWEAEPIRLAKALTCQLSGSGLAVATPLVTLANGPLMARRPCVDQGQSPRLKVGASLESTSTGAGI